jgi:hypothetical protein
MQLDDDANTRDRESNVVEVGGAHPLGFGGQGHVSEGVLEGRDRRGGCLPPLARSLSLRIAGSRVHCAHRWGKREASRQLASGSTGKGGKCGPSGTKRWVRNPGVTKQFDFLGKNALQIAILWVYEMLSPSIRRRMGPARGVRRVQIRWETFQLFPIFIVYKKRPIFTIIIIWFDYFNLSQLLFLLV